MAVLVPWRPAHGGSLYFMDAAYLVWAFPALPLHIFTRP